jgi:hypothetical protein
MTLRAIGQARGGKDYAAVGMALRRFEERLADEPSLVRHARRLGEMLYVET